MMKNNQKILIGIGIIIWIILISGCLNENRTLPTYQKYIPNSYTLTPLQICEKISEKEPKDRCFAWINESDKIKDEDFRNYYLAIETNDTSLCEDINSSLKLDCYEKLVEEEDILKYVDPSICEGQWYGCYFRFARISGNISLCDKIKEWGLEGIPEDPIGLKYEKEECYISTVEKTGDASVCENRVKDRERKDRCFGSVCVKTADIEYCEKIRDQSFKDIYYSFLAEEQNDTSYCEKIKDFDDKEWCKISVKYPGMSYTEHCEEIKSSEIKGQCYFQLAINKSDASLCGRVIDKYDKDTCYLIVAENTKNEESCKKINDGGRRDFCYFMVGVKKGNAQLCENIEGYQCKAGCLGLTKNPKYCDEITSPPKMRSYCLVDAAARNMDVEICDFECITDNCYHKNGCYSAVAKSIYDHENNITRIEEYYNYETYLCSKNIFNIFND